MLVKVKLLGKLGRLFGREWELHIKTPGEAIRAIACQTQGFTQFLHESEEDGIRYRVVTDDPQGLDLDAVSMPFCTQTLTIAPVAVGKGSFGRILLGAALIGVAFLVPGGVLGLSSTTIGLIGASLVVGGIAQLLTPTPKKPKENEKTTSYLFDRNQEVSQQGLCVPVLYGRRRISGLIVLSGGIDVVRRAV